MSLVPIFSPVACFFKRRFEILRMKLWYGKAIQKSLSNPLMVKSLLEKSYVRLYSSFLPSKEKTLQKFNFPVASHSINEINKKLDSFLQSESTITLNGHLNRKPRLMAKNSFAELRDSNGDRVQLILSPEFTDEKFFSVIENSIPEESVSVSGKVKLKQSRDGEKSWELLVSNYQVLNESNLDAARLDRLKHSNPQDLPPQFRYLQLRTEYLQKNLKTRSKAANLIRNIFVNNHDFVEIETPLLFKSTPEGAREFLVPTRTPDAFYALPQSPQQYKQLLMSSGFTKYFQIAKCFRDEDLRADRQPEFTQVDMEMSFVNHSDQVGHVVEDLVFNLWTKVAKLPVYYLNENGNLQELTNFSRDKINFSKLKYIDALTKFGIDKPDLRSSLEFIDLSDYFISTKSPETFPIVEACVLKNAFDPLGKSTVPKELQDSNNYSRRKPFIIPIKSDADCAAWFEKFLEKGVLNAKAGFDRDALSKLVKLAPGDILAFSDRSKLPYENPTPLGKFRQLAMSLYPNKWQRKIEESDGSLITTYDSSKVFVASWVVEFPLFNPVETTTDPTADYPTYDMDKYESTHHPFTMVNSDDYDTLSLNPLAARGEHYDLVMNGVEVGGGSRRVHDSELQKFIFKDVLKIENYDELFGHLLHALSMGCPPHAGLALGFDRLCAMLVGSNSIRDVIAFPKNQSGVDPIVESPTSVKELTLNEYFITKKL